MDAGTAQVVSRSRVGGLACVLIGALTLPSSTSSVVTSTTTLDVPSPTTVVLLGPAETTAPLDRCPAAYFGKCAPEIRADWNCPDADSDALPRDWTNVRVDPNVPNQDPWGLDSPPGPATDGIPDIGCEDRSVLGTSTSASSSSTSGATTAGVASSNATGTQLALTGSSRSVPIGLAGLGLVAVGTAAVWIGYRHMWLKTSDPRVHYTIESRSRPRR